MDQQEYDKILTSSRLLEERDSVPVLWSDPFIDMTGDEKSKLIVQFLSRLESNDSLIASLTEEVKRLTASQESSSEELRLVRSDLSRMVSLVCSLQSENASLREQLQLERKNRYGSKSQKGNPKGGSVSEEPVSREEAKDGF